MPVLDWLGKDKVINHHSDVPFRFLDKKFSVGESDNKIIHGDNLLALKSLLPEFAGRVRCIYIDPPYNTGNENWIYNDNVNDAQIKRWLGQVVGKEGEDLTRHDNRLCMMYPRLRLLQKLLSADGAIFISIDDNELANLKLICDEIFGANNFVANIAVINNFKGRSDDKFIATAHESLLIYRKEKFLTNGVPVPDEYVKEYKLEDERGKYRLPGLRKRDSNSRREDRPNMFYPFFYDEASGVLSVDELPDATEILPHLSDGTRRVKPKSFWLGTEFSAEAGTLTLKSIMGKGSFSTPKPVGIVEYILQQATDKDSIVPDSFAGSGTTAHAVINLNNSDGGNRKFILIELNDYAESITAERVKRVGGEFNFYELGATLFDDDGFINAEIPREQLFDYVYFMATHKHYEPADEENLLGLDDETVYYFFDEAELNFDLLAKIRTRATAYVIYAANCTLADSELDEFHITFKKIPTDIRRF